LTLLLLPLLLQISQEQGINAGEIYSTICVEWTSDHSGLGLT